MSNGRCPTSVTASGGAATGPASTRCRAAAVVWCRDVAGRRRHRGLDGAAPIAVFAAVEQPALRALPHQRFELAALVDARRSAPTATSTSAGALYSVPWRLIGRQVDARHSDQLVEVFVDADLVKTHRPGRAGPDQTDWADYPPEKVAFFMRTPAVVPPPRRRARPRRRRAHRRAARRSTRCIGCAPPKASSAWPTNTPPTRLDAACRRALEVGDPTYRTVKGILAAGTEHARPQPHQHHRSPPAHLHGPEPPVRTPTTNTLDRTSLIAVTAATTTEVGVMTRPHQLETTLRTLNLSGMLDTLDARLAQARAGELGHLEFLQALCEDEIARRDADRHRPPRPPRPLRATHHPRGLRLHLQPEDPRRAPSATSPPCASSTPASRSSSTAPSASARPIIAQALGHHACRHGHTAAFTKTSRLLADLAGGHADRTWGTRLRRWARPDVLILDDFAMRDFTPAQADDLYELVTERAGRVPRSSPRNRQPDDWYPLFPNPVVAESILDRLINTAHHHPHGRPQLPTQQPTPTTDHPTPRAATD